MGKRANPCRMFCLNDESGTVICSWPEGAHKPAIPVPYAEEAMNGFEYQAAAHMIQEGLTREGLNIVKAVRRRYDGERRNPWNEFECGSNYARSMASYSLLLAYSGFSFEKNCVGFNPAVKGDCSFFWAFGEGWGTYGRTGGRITLTVLYGNLRLEKFRHPGLSRKIRISVNRKRYKKFAVRKNELSFSEPLVLTENDALMIDMQK